MTIVIAIVTVRHADIVNGATLEARAMHFIGVGYDIIDGNPDGGDAGVVGVDPGLLVNRRILELTYKKSEISGDGKRGLADQCEFALRSGDRIQMDQTTFTGPLTYRDNLRSHVTQTTGNF